MYCTMVKVLIRAEVLNIEKMCSAIKMLNTNVSLFKRFDVEVGCVSKLQLAFTQVVTKIERISTKYSVHDSPTNCILNIMSVYS